MGLPAKKLEHFLPNKKEAYLANESSRTLAAYIASTSSPNIELIEDDGERKVINIPPIALHLLVDVLVEMSEGNAVALTPIQAELTTQEAANLLNVSRPYLVKLLDSNQIPSRKVGCKRRVLVKDLLEYKAEIESKRQSILGELAQKSQDLNLGYE